VKLRTQRAALRVADVLDRLHSNTLETFATGLGVLSADPDAGPEAKAVYGSVILLIDAILRDRS
jgi:hypothetical protein